METPEEKEERRRKSAVARRNSRVSFKFLDIHSIINDWLIHMLCYRKVKHLKKRLKDYVKVLYLAVLHVIMNQRKKKVKEDVKNHKQEDYLDKVNLVIKSVFVNLQVMMS